MRLLITGFTLSALLLTGCAHAQPATAVQVRPASATLQARQTEIGQATVKQVPALLKVSPKPLFIDVRQPEEYTAGHAPGAVVRPLSDLATWAPTLDPHAPILLICRTGHRSMLAATQLAAKGFTHLTVVQGGMTDWQNDGSLPVVLGPEPGTWPASRSAR